MDIGLQKLCNSPVYLDWARKNGAQIFFRTELKKAFTALKKAVQKDRPIYVSIDLDVFNSSLSSGTSNNWPDGLLLNEFMPFYELLLKKDCSLVGIYELVPSLDTTQITTKLAAHLAYCFVESRHD